jgi:hypothetical protein
VCKHILFHIWYFWHSQKPLAASHTLIFYFHGISMFTLWNSYCIMVSLIKPFHTEPRLSCIHHLVITFSWAMSWVGAKQKTSILETVYAYIILLVPSYMCIKESVFISTVGLEWNECILMCLYYIFTFWVLKVLLMKYFILMHGAWGSHPAHPTLGGSCLHVHAVNMKVFKKWIVS